MNTNDENASESMKILPPLKKNKINQSNKQNTNTKLLNSPNKNTQIANVINNIVNSIFINVNYIIHK